MTETLMERPPAPVVTTEQIDLIRRTVAKEATPDELKLYLYDCARQGVHPLDKLIHFTKRGGKYTPVTSIDFMRIRAAETGEMAGSDRAEFEGEPMTSTYIAHVTVYRLTQGQRFAYHGEASWTEYKPDQDFMWRRMPRTMLAKCAEAVALRKGFPRQLAGLYAKEELDQAPGSEAVSGDGVIEPPKTVIDVSTGEQVPSAERPPAPTGYRYIDAYRIEAGWHHVEFHRVNLDGSARSVKTKFGPVGLAAYDAFEKGIPVKYPVDATANKKKGEEDFLNAIELWKPERAIETVPTPSDPQVHAAPVDTKDLPF